MKKHTQVHYFQKKSIFVAISLALFSSANALTFSDPEVLSKRGEPLDAKIQILNATSQELDGLTALLGTSTLYRMYSIEVPHTSGAPLNINVKVVNENEKHHIRITSPQTVENEHIDLILQLKWATGKLIKGFGLAIAPQSTKRPVEIAQAKSQEKNSAVVSTAKPNDEVSLALSTSLDAIVNTGDGNDSFSAFSSHPDINLTTGQEVPKDGLAETTPAHAIIKSRDMDKLFLAIAENEKIPTVHLPTNSDNSKVPDLSNASVAPIAGNFQLNSENATITTTLGDTATKIAKKYVSTNRTLNQMLIALWKNNQSAFVNGDINRLKSNVKIAIPSPEQITLISLQEATREIEILYQNHQGQSQIESEKAAVELMYMITKAAVPEVNSSLPTHTSTKNQSSTAHSDNAEVNLMNKIVKTALPEAKIEDSTNTSIDSITTAAPKKPQDQAILSSSNSVNNSYIEKIIIISAALLAALAGLSYLSRRKNNL
jgi:FimV-like protein